MAKTDSKIQAQAPLLETSKTQRKRPTNPTPKIRRESINCAQSSKNTSPVKKYAVKSSPIHTKRALDTTSEISRPLAKRARLAKPSTAQTGLEDEEGRAGATTQRPLPKLPSASEIMQAQTPQFIPKRNSPDRESQSKPAQLTRRNLAQFNKMTGAAGSREPESITSLSTSWSEFARISRKNGILPPIESEPPANLEKLREHCAHSRRSPSPTPSEFEYYRNTVSRTMNEYTLQIELSCELLKKHRTRGFIPALNQQCTAFPNNVGFNNGLRTLKPGFMEGLVVDHFDPFPIDEYIEGAVMHDIEYPITLPHLAGEWKRNLDDARVQTAYDGASLTYARNQALAYLNQEELSNSAEVITFTSDGSTLTLYAHYASKGEDGTVKYHQCLIDQTFLHSYAGFKNGRKQLRNAQEYAKEQCYLLRAQLKEQWTKNNTNPKPVEQSPGVPLLALSIESPSIPSDSSAPCQVRDQKAPPSKKKPRVYNRGGVRRSRRKNAGLLSKQKKNMSDS